MGFGDNDHAIKELMRFIEMISRKFRFEYAIRNGGAPNYKYRWLETQKRFKILLYLEFEYRKSRTIKGDTMLKLNVLSSAQTTTSILRFTAKTVYISLLPLLSCVV